MVSTPNAPEGRRVDKFSSYVIAPESLRNGELCEVYKLTRGVESYKMNLLKELKRVRNDY